MNPHSINKKKKKYTFQVLTLLTLYVRCHSMDTCDNKNCEHCTNIVKRWILGKTTMISQYKSYFIPGSRFRSVRNHIILNCFSCYFLFLAFGVWLLWDVHQFSNFHTFQMSTNFLNPSVYSSVIIIIIIISGSIIK